MTGIVRRVLAFGDPRTPLPLFALVVAALLATLLNRTVHDVDIFWQLKLGELTLAHGSPEHEPFLAGREADHLPRIAWLGQAVFAGVRQLGGWPLLRLFDAVVWLSGFVLVARQAGRTAGNDVPASIALWAGWFAAVTFASVRPQTFAIAAFGLIVVLARSKRPAWQTIPLAVVVLVVGQNMHPSTAVVGAIYLAASSAGEWGLWLIRSGPRPGVARLLLVPLAALASLATPDGMQVFADGAVNRDRSLHMHITEWLPIWDIEYGYFGRNYAAPILVAVAVVVAIRGKRAKAADLLPVAVLTVMTILTFRFVVFWGIAVLPVLVACLTPDEVPPASRPHPARKWIAAGLLLAAAVVPVALRPYTFADYFSFDAIRALKAENVRGPVYCNYFWGGLITDFGHPDWKPTHDGRYYLFTRDQLDAHQAAGRGEVPLEKLEAEFQPVAFFLRPQWDDELIEIVAKSERWRPVYADENAAVFVRN